jgi:hypothetical protein
MSEFIFYGLFDTAAKASAHYMEKWQRNWLSMMAQGEAASGAGGSTGSKGQATADELARSMDIVIGAR